MTTEPKDPLGGYEPKANAPSPSDPPPVRAAVAAAREYLAYADEGLNRVDPWIGVRHLRNVLASPDPPPVSREAVGLLRDRIAAWRDPDYMGEEMAVDDALLLADEIEAVLRPLSRAAVREAIRCTTAPSPFGRTYVVPTELIEPLTDALTGETSRG